MTDTGMQRCSRWANGRFAGMNLCWQHEAKMRAGLERDAENEPGERKWLLRVAAQVRAQDRAAEDERLLCPDPDVAEGSVVYFLQRHRMVKIGVTTNLAKRMQDIAKGSSIIEGMAAGPVKLLATIAGDRRKEAALHGRFKDYRVAGEWFLFCDDLWDFLRLAERRGVAWPPERSGGAWRKRLRLTS